MSSEQKEVLELITKAKGTGAEASTAAARLVDIGMPAVAAIVEAIRQSPLPSKALLDIIPQIRAPELVPAMIEALNERSPFLPIVASKALGQSKDERAFQPLLNLFLNENRSDAIRSWAANALGELGDTRAVPELLKTVKDIARRRKLKEHAAFVRFTVIALAKLGNQDAADIVISMTEHRDRSVREEAMLALKHIIGRGLFPTLQKSRRRKSTTARQESLEAIFYLGLRESIEELISFLEEDDGSDPDLSVNIIYRLSDLTGEHFEEDIKAEELRQWWAQHQSTFQPNVCYRLGKPISISDMGALLETKDLVHRYWLLEELRLITGKSVGLNRFKPLEEQDVVVARAQAWVREEGHRFERGAVYKYGYKQNIDHIFEAPMSRESQTSHARSRKAEPEIPTE